MDIGYVDHALDYLYTKYQRRNMNQYLFKSQKDIVQEPFLRNFYAGIKPSALDYLYPNRDKTLPQTNLHYKKPIQRNKRLCPWTEKKLPKHRRVHTKKPHRRSPSKPNPLFYTSKQFPIKKYQMTQNLSDDSSYDLEYSEDEYEIENELNSKLLSVQQILIARYFFKWLSAIYQRRKRPKRILKNQMTMTTEKGIQELTMKKLRKERKIRNSQHHVDEVDQIIDDVIFDDSYKRRYVHDLVNNG